MGICVFERLPKAAGGACYLKCIFKRRISWLPGKERWVEEGGRAGEMRARTGAWQSLSARCHTMPFHARLAGGIQATKGDAVFDGGQKATQWPGGCANARNR